MAARSADHGEGGGGGGGGGLGDGSASTPLRTQEATRHLRRSVPFNLGRATFLWLESLG